MSSDGVDGGEGGRDGRSGVGRVLIVSNDSHVGPPVAEYRPYCPQQYLAEFDDWAQAASNTWLEGELNEQREANKPPAYKEAMAWALSQPMIHFDPRTALRHMDEDGVAVQVLFHGAQNGYPIPFLGNFGFGTGKPWAEGARGAELAHAGMRMYNRWLADYCSVASERFIGLAQFPMWDVDLAIEEIKFACEAGLRGLNFPAPRPTIPDYNELIWEPLWATIEDLQMPLNTHGASSPTVLDIASYTGEGGRLCMVHETVQFSRRAVPFMILGGVFDRHPALTLILTEQPSDWVESTLRDLDGLAANSIDRYTLPRRPSEYFRTNCYVGVSFMSNAEAQSAVRQGLESNVLWGSDYPHVEGTWPYTRLSLRQALQGVASPVIQRILGLNAVTAYHLDLAPLAPIVVQIGASIDELTTPPTPDELAAERTGGLMAFRQGTSFG